MRLQFILSLGEMILNMCPSFELGGEKKTKGAALTFVSVVSLFAVDVLKAVVLRTVTIYLTPMSLTSPPLLCSCIQSVMRRNTPYVQARVRTVVVIYYRPSQLD